VGIAEHGVETYPAFSVGKETVVTDGGAAFYADGGNLPNDGGLKLSTAIIRPDKLTAVNRLFQQSELLR
jgi:Amt family ammonium transporter